MPERPPIYRFGPFEFDPHAGELRKFGHKLRVQGNPILVLTALLEAGGELVTREELHQKIWPADTFVDFEHGLNTAVAKLRQALADSALGWTVKPLKLLCSSFVPTISESRLGTSAISSCTNPL